VVVVVVVVTAKYRALAAERRPLERWDPRPVSAG
jgi:hypothetical protein